jgi:hypothetical protein
LICWKLSFMIYWRLILHHLTKHYYYNSIFFVFFLIYVFFSNFHHSKFNLLGIELYNLLWIAKKLKEVVFLLCTTSQNTINCNNIFLI